VSSLFTLNDFTEALGLHVKNLTSETKSVHMPFTTEWMFKAPNPTLGHVLSKSEPLLDADTIYVGSDNEHFYAINQSDGSLKWKYRVGKKAFGKSIFSNPALYKNLIIFGAYDGNVYALDKTTGKRVWISFEADFVGSSPAVSEDLGLVFIGLEFGLFRKHGGIVALDAKTGETVWLDNSHPAFTHSSPAYIAPYQQVVIGSNDGGVRLYNAKDGTKIWEFTTFGGTKFNKEEDRGFGEGEIKESFVYDDVRDYIIFGATDGFLYILDRGTGHMVKQFACEFAVFATPYLYKDKVYFTSLDKHLRCIDLDTLELIFAKNLDGSRLFGSPTVINNRLYVGTNAGKLHELDPLTGETLGHYHTLERITNSVHYNQETNTYFLPTYANEIIALKRKEA
jgi:outer membrane protein assembly factor BamB